MPSLSPEDEETDEIFIIVQDTSPEADEVHDTAATEAGSVPSTVDE